MALDNDYEQLHIAWTRKRYYDWNRRMWVENWVGDMRFGKTPDPNPDQFVDEAAKDFVPNNRGRRSSIAGKVEAALAHFDGTASSRQLSAYLDVGARLIRRYANDHPQHIEVVRSDGGYNLYRLIEQEAK